jgi:hypothetical protein
MRDDEEKLLLAEDNNNSFKLYISKEILKISLIPKGDPATAIWAAGN